MYALIAAFVLAATPAWAQNIPIPNPIPLVDKNGVKVGTVTQAGNRQYVRNIKEELLAVIVIDKDGTRTAYDPEGKIIRTDKPTRMGPQ